MGVYMSVEDVKREVIGAPMQRQLVMDRKMSVDEETRTVTLAFASDKPVDHYFGSLKLAMGEDFVRTTRLRSGLPLLLDHDRTKQIGVIEGYNFGDDGMARATVRFSRSAAASEIFQDVVDGIRTNVSVGFIVHEMHLESDDDEAGPVYRSDDWEVLEISLVSIPADISVGVGRSIGDRKIQTTEQPNEMAEEKVEREEISEAAKAAAITEDYVRFARNYGEGYEDLAKDYALSGKSFDALKGEIKARRAEETPAVVPPKPAEKIAADAGVQIARTIPRTAGLKNFRGPDADKIAYRSGMWMYAQLTGNQKAVQFCRENGLELNRIQSGTSNAAGGFLVPEEFENVMIDLRIQYGVFRPNANVVPMMSDTKTRPRRTGGLTAYAVGAGDSITQSTKGWDNVSLVAKKWGVLAKWENELGEDAVINMADDLAGEIAYAFAQKEDECGFNGDATSTYHGIQGIIPKLKGLSGTIANIAGLQVASGNLYSEVVLADLNGVVGRLPQFARRSGGVKWYCSHSVFANVLERLANAAGGVSKAEIEGQWRETFFGYPVEIVEVMPATEANSQVCLLFGNLSMAAMLGDRRGVTIALSDSNDTDFEKDQMSIRGTTRFDINVHDVGNASATAADRLAGPVVGLITAAS